MTLKSTRIDTRWAMINPARIASEASPAHITSVLTDMQRDIADLHAQVVGAYQALVIADAFMSGFEDDNMQVGIKQKLATIHRALVRMETVNTAIAKQRMDVHSADPWPADFATY